MAKQSTPPDTAKLSQIYILPSFFTAGNLFFGFLAIIRCIQAKYGIDEFYTPAQFYTQAVWFILMAFICDALDGRIARLGGQESLFGKEFDSIADIVSFGIAPALMVFFLILSPTEGYPIFRQVGWLIGFIYLLCSGVRLARFNVLTHPLLPEHEKQSNPTQSVGLPVPAAAALIASLVLVFTDLESPRFVFLFMPPLMLLIAWLMVSSIPYPSFKTIDWHTEIRFRNLVALIAIMATLFFFKEFAFALIFLTYIFYGLLRHISQSFRVKLKIPGKYS